ncbi:MAG: hypothetical protein Q7S73_00775 [bacterium]|nr:hypothetical protein [bacterium]
MNLSELSFVQKVLLPFKKPTIFIDELAKKDLASYRITPKEVLEGVNAIYKENGINFAYLLNDLEIREWRYRDSWWDKFRFLMVRLKDSGICGVFIKDFLLNKLGNIHKTNLSLGVVVIGFSGCVNYGSGQAYLGKYGNGPYIIGTRTDFTKERFEYLKMLAHNCAHEQGHLYGLLHVDDKEFIMHAYSDFCNTKFDEISKKKLLSVLSGKANG